MIKMIKNENNREYLRKFERGGRLSGAAARTGKERKK